ncbi:EC12a protein [Colletotrichum higginsianum IMI 349063]|uniref:EC12a protein n=1 Tax=Colletotrichum higginsianum (strain IMI 349063) TaxID=759273 RepID=A0A1B7XQQ5_COLHI|nr:EC12a protein [Colletotrichum higginsianum IMI 349063]OBR02088.1 EC12a protein [Colletotrichum higginsianum IMI 349063]
MKLLPLLAITTLVAAEVTNKEMKCQYVNLTSYTTVIHPCLHILSCISHGWQRNTEHTSMACQKRAGRGVQGIYEKGYCYVDADEKGIFINNRVD